MDVANLAIGKWRGILSSLGIDDACLSGKHCACPLCGGKDRWRFDDKAGKGTWICNHCGAGDGFKLLMKYYNIGFKECAVKVKAILGTVEYCQPKAKIADEQIKKSLQNLWRQSVPVMKGDWVDRYLINRGIEDRPASLRTVDRCRNSAGAYHPAMLAIISDIGGKPVTMHRTYLGDGKKAEIDSPRELMPGKLPDGSSVRLGDAMPLLGIAEGIETALAASRIHKIPVWAAINATMLEKWEPPPETASVVIFGDNDRNYRGQKAAYTLAYKLSIKGCATQVIIPDKIGYDWNDVLMENE